MIDKPDLAKLYGAHEITTFLGIKRCSDLETLTAPIALIGAQSGTPYASVGAYCRNAPTVLRQALAPFAANIQLAVGGCFPKAYTEMPDFEKRAAPYYARWKAVALEDVDILEKQHLGLTSCLARPRAAVLARRHGASDEPLGHGSPARGTHIGSPLTIRVFSGTSASLQ
jgi:hypothetical protein